MQRFIVIMEKLTRVERGPARQRHGIKCQPHKKCQIANNEVAYPHPHIQVGGHVGKVPAIELAYNCKNPVIF